MPENDATERDLREQIRLLTLENERLAERTEDSLLLGLIAEKINRTDAPGEILAVGLEQVSILKDIALTSFWELRGETATLLASYCSRTTELGAAPEWRITPGLSAALDQGPRLLTETEWQELRLFPVLGAAGVSLQAALCIRVRFASGADGLFLFGIEQAGTRLTELQALLTRSAELIAARYENVALLHELQELYDALDRRVEQRTAELSQANDALEQQIRERQAAEHSLALSEQRFRQAFTHGPLAMVLANLDGRFIEVNQAFCRFLGYAAEELLQLSIREISHPNDWPRNVEVLSQTLAHAESVYSIEKRYVRKDGQIVWGSVSTAILRDAQGEASLRIGLIEDITKHKEAEQALQERQQLQEQLAQAQKMESVGRLAGGVAHDFNNLLTAIIVNCEVAQETADALHSPDVSNCLREIQSAGQRAAELTRQLLAFSRKQVLSMKVVDLNDSVAGLGKLLKRLISEDVLIKLVLGSNLGVVKADPSQVEQVLLNLALNARDAMPKGGHLTIETAPATLDVAQAAQFPEARPGDYAVISVSDDGCGMDPETLRKIFEPFFTTKPVGQGTGLGLATVYGIMRQHGGHVHCTSELGCGSTFQVFFPRIPAENAASAGPAAAPEKPPGGTETILLVEDNAMVRQLTSRLLEGLGYRVLEADGGAAALRLAQQHQAIDLLLTDVVMPHLSGRQVHQQVSALHPGIKTIYASGYTDEVITRHEIAATGALFVQKPFRSLELAKAVRQALKV